MALVSKGPFVRITLADAAGNKSNLNLSTTYADLAALSTGVGSGDIATMLGELEAVTDARVVGYSLGESFAEDANYYGAAGSQVENVALVTARIDGEPGKSATIKIPAPADGIFVGTLGPDANTVDTADSDLVAWLANFETGALFEVSDGEHIADSATPSNFKGKRVHRASRNG